MEFRFDFNECTHGSWSEGSVHICQDKNKQMRHFHVKAEPYLGSFRTLDNLSALRDESICCILASFETRRGHTGKMNTISRWLCN